MEIKYKIQDNTFIVRNICTKGIYQLGLMFLLILLLPNKAKSQLTPSEAGYIDAVVDFGAINNGTTITTTQLQAAIDASISQGKGLFLPAGRYLIDRQLNINIPLLSNDDLQQFVLQGSSVNASQRSVLVLKSGTFPSESTKGYMLRNVYYDGGTTRTYNRNIQSVDFEMQSNNAGAIALSWRGAEGCAAFDININATGGYAGISETSGSGGSMADITIIGGKIGVNISTNGGTQPTPVFTAFKFSGQTESCFKNVAVRGAFVLTGCEFIMNPGIPVLKAQRHNTFTYHYGGCPLFTDCKIEYTTPDANNKVIQFTSTAWDISFNFNNVYVKNAAKIVEHDALVLSNENGWRHFSQLTYNSGPRTFNQGTFDDGIYLESVRQSDVVRDIHTDVTVVPANLTSYHGWGNTFPSFETPGAVNVKDFSGSVVEGDWSAAFNQAIASATANGSNVVFVPLGSYDIYNTINLDLHTRLIGVSHHHSVIYGWDKAGKRFGGSTDSWSDPRPMVQTPDNLNADNILADLGIRMVGPYDNISHNPEPCIHYAILWRAGKNSIIRHLNTEPETSTHYRAGYVYDKTLGGSKWISLKVLPGVTQISGFNFYGDNESKFSNHTSLPAGNWLETVNGTKRLMARSISPFNNIDNAYGVPNLIIEKSAGGTFSLSSIKVSQSSFNPMGGDDIKIAAFNGTSKLFEKIVSIKGLNKPRDIMDQVTMSWSGITKVVITSGIMFSIDDVVIDGVNINFDGLTGLAPVVDVGCETALYYDPGRDLPLSMLNHHIVKITGGVKWYNHRKHGDTWMRPTQAYVCIENNKAPVNIYHFHAQHSQNDQKLLLINAKDVSVWGIKTENAGYFARVINSDNVRIFGHGGLTSAPPRASHYYFENTPNYLISAPTDEIYGSDDCQYCGSGSAILPRVRFDKFDVIIEKIGTVTNAPLRTDRPILWLRGTGTRPAYYDEEQTIVLRDPENPSNTLPGLNYNYYEGTWTLIPDFSTLTSQESGNINNFNISVRNRDDNFAINFTGYINVPANGEYTFYTSSDDGSKLYIGSTEVVNNDGSHGIREKSGKIGLKAGKHAITVSYFERSGGNSLSVSYEGPNISKVIIPDGALYRVSLSNPAPFFTLNPIDDSQVSYGASIDLNSGTSENIRNRNSGATSQYTNEPYFKFDMRAYSGTVDNATLRLYGNRVDGINPSSLFLVHNDSWNELTITGNNQPQEIGEQLGVYTPVAGAYVDISINPELVESELNGDGIISIKSKATNSIITIFTSKEGDVTKVPQLIVNDPSKSYFSAYTNKNDQNTINLLIHPNPANHSFTIQVPGEDKFVLSIIDMNGRLVYQTDISNESNKVGISHLKGGLYFVQIKNSTNIYYEKILIQK